MSFCRRQDEYHVLRRLLKSLKERIERPYRQHMNLIYDIDLIPSFRRPVRHFLTDLTDIVHAVVGRRVDLNHVHGCARRDRPAHGTFPARAPVRRILAIHRLCKYLRHASLPRSARPAEQVRMSDTPRLDLILQCPYYGVLPLHIFEFIRTELPV